MKLPKEQREYLKGLRNGNPPEEQEKVLVMKRMTISMSIPGDLLWDIDLARGAVSRSAFLVSLIEAGLGDKETIYRALGFNKHGSE